MQTSFDSGISNWIKGEWAGIRSALAIREPIEPKLYTYPVVRADGSYKRLHLRVTPEGRGILFVDVTDVIHLNHEAVRIVKMALEGVRQQDAARIMRSSFRVNGRSVQDEVAKAYQVVDHLSHHDDGCTTCSLTGLIDQAPLFSLPTTAPYKIDIALTYGCNNQCPHCYNEASRLAMPSLPLDHWKRVLDWVAEMGIPHVILTGGEATLHPDFVEIVRYADSLGMIVGLNSNGRYLGKQSYMQEIGQAGLNHVQITLGSCYPDVHDAVMGAKSFHQTVKGIRTAIESGVHVITNTTLMRSNMDHLEELVDFLDELGIRTFAMNGMIYSGGGFTNTNALHTSELPALIAHVRDLADERGMRFLWYTPTEYCRLSPVALGVGSKKCNAGEYSICIEPNGDVLPCQSYYVSAGNILNDPWEQIWDGTLFTSFRDREDAPGENGLPAKCWECPDLLVCGSGCRIEREAEQGVRVAEMTGAGCSGCSSFTQPVASVQVAGLMADYEPVMEGSFIPFDSLVRTDLRSTGQMNVAVRSGKDIDE